LTPSGGGPAGAGDRAADAGSGGGECLCRDRAGRLASSCSSAPRHATRSCFVRPSLSWT